MSEEEYKSKYIRNSKIKELFEFNNKKVRISSEATPMVIEYLDQKVIEGVDELIKSLPKKSKGDSKGDLKRITILQEDVNKTWKNAGYDVEVIEKEEEEEEEEEEEITEEPVE